MQKSGSRLLCVNRRAFLTTFPLLAALCLWFPSLPTHAADETVTLTVLHTNDLHGHILPFAYTEVERSKVEKPSVGGAARRATLIRRIRAATKNPVILVDSGDTFTRGPFTNAYEGIADAEAMNAIGYELAAIGNNEFKAKDATEEKDAAGAQAALLNVVKRSRFPWLCANATDSKGAILEGVQPFVVRQYGPLRVGFLGLTAPRVANYPQAKGWTISDPVEAAKKYIPLARAQCDVLIGLTHIGFDLDKKLAAETTGLDAIVGGDSHTFLYSAVEVKNADGSRTVPIVQDGEFGVNLGKFDLRFQHAADGWRLAGYRYGLIPVGPDLPEAPDVAAVVAPFAAPLQTVVGILPPNLVGKSSAQGGGYFTTQVLVDALRRRLHADYAINPDGSGFFEWFRTPTVRRYDVYAALPFKNHAVLTRMTGARLRTLLTAVPKDPAVKNSMGRPQTVVSGDLSTLDDAKEYTVALVDFNAAIDYKLPPESLQPTGRDIRDLLIEDLGAQKK